MPATYNPSQIALSPLEDIVRLKRMVSTLFLCALFTAPISLSGQSGSPRPPHASGDFNVAPSNEEDSRQQMMHEMAKKANVERQTALRTDADKLFKLATELKTYVEKSNEHVMSVDVIKKADEIEKLARSVKDKMKGPN
jgi:hypothetical protein